MSSILGLTSLSHVGLAKRRGPSSRQPARLRRDDERMAGVSISRATLERISSDGAGGESRRPVRANIFVPGMFWISATRTSDVTSPASVRMCARVTLDGLKKSMTPARSAAVPLSLSLFLPRSLGFSLARRSSSGNTKPPPTAIHGDRRRDVPPSGRSRATTTMTTTRCIVEPTVYALTHASRTENERERARRTDRARRVVAR